MLENVLEVGERPDDLVVYASLAKAARDWPSFHQIVAALKDLRDDETLVVQSGKPIGVLQTHPNAPVVIMACSNYVGRWATPDNFYQQAQLGRTMWGGLTAGDWQYIGSQGVLQGTYEVLRAVARQHFDGSLRGKWVLTAGLGGMGSAQPLAVSMAGGVGLFVEVDRQRLEQRASSGYLNVIANDLDSALEMCQNARAEQTPHTVGIWGNAAEVYTEIAARGLVPDVVTDQTSAHDAVFGYVPCGMTIVEWEVQRATDPRAVEQRARESMAAQVRAMLRLRAAGAIVFENGNNLRAQARDAGVEEAFQIDGFAEAYLRPLFCRGIGPFRWIALSGSVDDLETLDDLAAELFPCRPEVATWIELARRRVPIQGLPARSCWLGHGERARMALATNAAVAAARVKAPVLFTRDHLDSASMTHPYIGTERMRDGSDAVSDWPILDALLMCSTGADLVAVHAGGGGYAGYMQSTGVSIVADGSGAAAERLYRALDGDTGLGVMRYADAGYEDALRTAASARLRRIVV
jgi:urocanate hydratase